MRLLRVLQTVSTLAAATAQPPPTTTDADADADTTEPPTAPTTPGATEALRGLPLGALWDELSACMGAVAALEGLSGGGEGGAEPAVVAMMAVDGEEAGGGGGGGEAAPVAAAAAAAAAPAAGAGAERRPSLAASSSLAGLLARCVGSLLLLELIWFDILRGGGEGGTHLIPSSSIHTHQQPQT